MSTSKTILFHEEQRFRQIWLIILLLIGMLLPIGILVSTMVRGEMGRMEFTLSLLAVIVIEIPILVFFNYTKLETIVVPEGLGYRWWPLQRKYRMLFKDDISEIKIRKRPSLNSGIHWIPGYGWVHNVWGGMGIQLKLKSGKRLYIGSQRIDEFRLALEKLLNLRIGDFRNEF